MSVLPHGASAIGDGILVSNGVSQLDEMSEYFSQMGISEGEEEDKTLEELEEKLEEEKMNILRQKEKAEQKYTGELTFVKGSSVISQVLINLLPFAILIGIWFFIMKRMSAGGGAGAAGASSAFFFSLIFLMRLTKRKMEKAMMRKSNVCCRKFP